MQDKQAQQSGSYGSEERRQYVGIRRIIHRALSTKRPLPTHSQVRSAASSSGRLICDQDVESTTRHLDHDFSPSEEPKETGEQRDREEYFYQAEKGQQKENANKRRSAGRQSSPLKPSYDAIV
jgi:hypothetical protein